MMFSRDNSSLRDMRQKKDTPKETLEQKTERLEKENAELEVKLKRGIPLIDTMYLLRDINNSLDTKDLRQVDQIRRNGETIAILAEAYWKIINTI